MLKVTTFALAASALALGVVGTASTATSPTEAPITTKVSKNVGAWQEAKRRKRCYRVTGRSTTAGTTPAYSYVVCR